jgi:hypothetical protein
LLHGANIKGELFLADARIEGYLAFGGGRFINPGNWAIRAPNVRVGGNLTLKIEEGGFAPHGAKTVIEGGFKLDRARIEGASRLEQSELRGPDPRRRQRRSAFVFATPSIGGPHPGDRADRAAGRASSTRPARACSALDDDVKTGWGAESGAPRRSTASPTAHRQRRREIGARASTGCKPLASATARNFSPQPFTHAAQHVRRAWAGAKMAAASNWRSTI